MGANRTMTSHCRTQVRLNRKSSLTLEDLNPKAVKWDDGKRITADIDLSRPFQDQSNKVV